MNNKTTLLIHKVINKGLIISIILAGMLSSLFPPSASAQTMQDTLIAYFNLIENIP